MFSARADCIEIVKFLIVMRVVHETEINDVQRSRREQFQVGAVFDQPCKVVCLLNILFDLLSVSIGTLGLQRGPCPQGLERAR